MGILGNNKKLIVNTTYESATLVYTDPATNAETSADMQPGNISFIPKALLSKEEYDLIKITAVLEWNMMLVGQKINHKTGKKIHEKRKKERKENEQKFLEWLARMEAKARSSRRK